MLPINTFLLYIKLTNFSNEVQSCNGIKRKAHPKANQLTKGEDTTEINLWRAESSFQNVGSANCNFRGVQRKDPRRANGRVHLSKNQWTFKSWIRVSVFSLIKATLQSTYSIDLFSHIFLNFLFSLFCAFVSYAFSGYDEF